MSVNSKPTHSLVYTPRALHQLVSYLRKQSRFALDTESDSLYSYYGKVCLIQISAYSDEQTRTTAEVVDYLVDPLRLDSLTPLGELCADPTTEVVMHAADNDILVLYRSYGFTFGRVFDTQLAARILGWSQVGLAALLEKHFGIVSDKRMQRTDWGKRPLTPQQIAYAQMDTHYLLALRDLLQEELQQRGRWEEAQDAFATLTATNPAARPAEERTFWQMKTVREAPREGHGVLESLWQWREEEARTADRPPFKVVNDAVLVDLTKLQPESRAALADIPGLSELQVRRYGDDLLRAIRDGRTHPLPPLPNGDGRPEHQLDKAAQACYDALRRWRTETARTRGVDADIVLPNSTLLAIVQSHPAALDDLAHIAELSPWKVRHYGPQILATLAQPAAPQPAS
jgi:ribonuclease D